VEIQNLTDKQAPVLLDKNQILSIKGLRDKNKKIEIWYNGCCQYIIESTDANPLKELRLSSLPTGTVVTFKKYIEMVSNPIEEIP